MANDVLNTGTSRQRTTGEERRAIGQKIYDMRQRLLDTSLRNPIINFSFRTRAKSLIRIIDEVPAEILAKFVAAKSLQFEPIPDPEIHPEDESTPEFKRALQEARRTDEIYLKDLEKADPRILPTDNYAIERPLRNRLRARLGMAPWARIEDPVEQAKKLGIPYEFDLPYRSSEKRHQDNRIQTLLFDEDLSAKLHNIRREAETTLDGTGVWALNAAFGFLEWTETRESSKVITSPLMIMPVKITEAKEKQRFVYHLESADEDPTFNRSLAKKLRDEFGFEIPSFEDFLDKDGDLELNRWLETIHEAAKSINARWQVRNQVAIGLMAITRQAMYDDTDPSAWPDTRDPRQNESIQAIFGEAAAWNGMPPTEHDIDRVETTPEAPLLLLDADASQHDAVVDALQERSMVIQGPPGTGKSQTITNMISAFLAKGKRVLFLAEKLAALRVVKSRLDHAGLGDFVFEIHGATPRQEFYAALKKRLEAKPPVYNPRDLENTKTQLDKLRNRLTSYVATINAPAGDTELTAHDILWSHTSTRDKLKGLPRAIADISIENPLALNKIERKIMASMAEALEQTAEAMGQFAPPSKQPWRGIGRNDITEFDLDEVEALGEATIAAITRLEADIRAFNDLIGQEISSATCDQIVADLQAISAGMPKIDVAALRTAGLNENLLARLSRQNQRENAVQIANLLKRIQGARQALADLSVTPSDFEVNPREEGGPLDPGTLRGAHERLQRLGQISKSMDTLASEGEVARQSLPKNTTATDALAGIAQLLGLPDLERSDLAIALLDVLKNPLPRQAILEIFHPELAREDTEERLRMLQSLTRDLRTAYTTIGTDLPATEIPTFGELRIAANTIKHTSFFGRLFGGQYKAAKQLATRLSPGLHGKPADALLECLEAAMDWWSAQTAAQEFRAANPQLVKACVAAGDDFAALLEAAAWMAGVAKTISVSNANALALRHRLCRLTQEEAIRLTSFATSHGSDLRAIASFGTPDQTLADILKTKLEVMEVEESCRRDLSLVGWPSDRSFSDLLPVAAAIDAYRAAAAALAAVEAPETVLGDCWRGHATDPQEITAAINVADLLAPWKSPAREKAFADLGVLEQIRSGISNLTETARETARQMTAFSERLGLGEEWVPSAATPAQADMAKYRERIASALPHRDLLVNQSALLIAEMRADEAGLKSLLAAWRSADLPYIGLVPILDAIWYRSAARVLVKQNAALSNHVGNTHQSDRLQFQKLDQELLKLNAKYLAHTLHKANIPAGYKASSRKDYTDRVLIEHQTGLTRPSMSIRRLLAQAGDAALAMKPCFMMSPSSVSTFLVQDGVVFDVCIIDEASQMRPEDALGAIFRSKQLIVVGDKEQLPPTNFFRKSLSDEEQEEDEVIEASILELAERAWKPVRSLNWHYRSRHETLIEFSNKRFYNSRLIVFPSDEDASDDVGVSLERVAGVYGDKINEIEARAVVAAAIKHMETKPDRSLGIVALNTQQADLIDRLLQEALRTNQNASAYRDLWSTHLEKFFVKNLESVQGDERDSIFISTIFGPNAEGVQHNNFGPIGGAGGYRRLNVLFSRAKFQTRVFTSLDPSQIKDGLNNGAATLRDYLDFAAGHKVPPLYDPNGTQPDSPFEEWVLKRLSQMGYACVPQVGIRLDSNRNAYRIDIGVRHPTRPGRFILGIECDGATYHSARSARERDRLRQNVIEQLGWKIHRIWSTDWFRDPERELERIDNRIKQLMA
jgi:hypothetical protein